MQWVYNASPALNELSDYPTVLGVSIPLCFIMIIVVGMRFHVRFVMLKRPHIDDLCILFAALFSVVYLSLTIVQSRYGLGLPLAVRPKENLNKYSEVNFTGRFFYMAGILLFKVALCLEYLRILPVSKPTYRLVVKLVMTFAIMAHVTLSIVLFCFCSPIKKSWRPLTPGKCLPSAPVNYSLSAIVIACDVTIFLLPIPFLHGLRMLPRRKYAIIGMFVLGLFTTVCTALRWAQNRVVAYGDGNSTMLVVWGNVEMNVGIILTCLPVLAPLFTYFNQVVATKSYKSRGTAGDSNSHAMNVFKRDTRTSRIMSKYHTSNLTSTESQETILSEDEVANGKAGAGGITKTVHIEVESAEKRESKGESQRTFFEVDEPVHAM